MHAETLESAVNVFVRLMGRRRWIADCGSGLETKKLRIRVDFVYAYVYIVLGVMGQSLFDQFAAMVERLPTRAVVSAVILQRKMLEDDLAHKRTVSINDVRSIFAFCDFLENTPETTRLPKAAVPIRHLELYRATIKRLVEAGELPWESAGLFDTVFSAAGLESLKTS